MQLTDIPCLGVRFTWFSGCGKVMSRLDIFLLSDNLIPMWNITAQWIGFWDISDHCPIWMKSKCAKIELVGRGDYRLCEKLMRLKERLKWWNKNVFGWIDLGVENDVKMLWIVPS
ncbi:unnamed protein product [Lathyrus sativus]|nr:unnamed protein product [Lathyrus sativus]